MTGCYFTPVLVACLPYSARVLSPCIATLDDIRVRAPGLSPPLSWDDTPGYQT